MNMLTTQAARRHVADAQRDRHARENDCFAFLYLPEELREIAHLLSEGWKDPEIEAFLSLQPGQLEMARDSLGIIYCYR